MPLPGSQWGNSALGTGVPLYVLRFIFIAPTVAGTPIPLSLRLRPETKVKHSGKHCGSWSVVEVSGECTDTHVIFEEICGDWNTSTNTFTVITAVIRS